MSTWRLRLRPRSPWATPWRADSLFGAICWRWLELFPRSFEAMIDEFLESSKPPFVLSDAFSGDLFPLPSHIAPIISKKPRLPIYISAETFQKVIEGETSAVPVVENVIAVTTRIQTAIDREMGAGAEGQLFETEAQYLTTPDNTLTVYIRSERYMDEITACFRALAWTGFGKKSSTGLGQFEVSGPPETCDWLEGIHGGADAWVALSHFVPAPGDPTDGRWRTHVTYPKFHGNAAVNVFKGSILMLTPGSIFRTRGEPPRLWYGSMIPVPRPEMPKAIHYALSFAVPVKWNPQAL